MKRGTLLFFISFFFIYSLNSWAEVGFEAQTSNEKPITANISGQSELEKEKTKNAQLNEQNTYNLKNIAELKVQNLKLNEQNIIIKDLSREIRNTYFASLSFSAIFWLLF